MDMRHLRVSLLELPKPTTTGWAAYTVEIHFVTKVGKQGAVRLGVW